MKLELEKDAHLLVKKETGNKSFSLSNHALMISMVRDKVYKNIFRIIPQEYMSNARDAHRECGREDIPIEVHLPTEIDHNLKIRDFGPGIDDTRIQIFSQYGESTKRTSDNQTGGFGIGCKCAWKYTESFNIETVFIKDGKKIKRIYSLYIKFQSDPGNYRIVSEKEVDDSVPTGTTVSIPIMANDLQKITHSVISVCKFWKTKPKIFYHNEIFDESALNPIKKNEDEDEDDFGEDPEDSKPKDCKFFDTHVLYNGPGIYGIDNKCFLIIDGICYNVDIELLIGGKSQYEEINGETVEVQYRVDNRYRPLLTSRIGIFFNTGEVLVSPDRETLDYTVGTIKAIKDKLELIAKAASDKIDAFIQTNNDYLFRVIKYYYDLGIKIPYMYKDLHLENLVSKLATCHCIMVHKTKNVKFKFDFDYVEDKYQIVMYKSISTSYERRDDFGPVFETYNSDLIILLDRNEKELQDLVTIEKIAVKKKKSSVPNAPKVEIIRRLSQKDLSKTLFLLSIHNVCRININGSTKVVSHRKIERLLPNYDIQTINYKEYQTLIKHKFPFQLADNQIHQELLKYADDKLMAYYGAYFDSEIVEFIRKFKNHLLKYYKNDRRMRLLIKTYCIHYNNERISSQNDSIYRVAREMLIDFQMSRIRDINVTRYEERFKKMVFYPLVNLLNKSANNKKFIMNIIRSYHE